MSVVANYRRATVSTPDGTLHEVRFVFHAGRAAVWKEDRNAGTAQRLMLVEGATFTKARRASIPHVLTLSDGTEVSVKSHPAGCGCTPTPLKGMSMQKMLDPSTSVLP